MTFQSLPALLLTTLLLAGIAQSYDPIIITTTNAATYTRPPPSFVTSTYDSTTNSFKIRWNSTDAFATDDWRVEYSTTINITAEKLTEQPLVQRVVETTSMFDVNIPPGKFFFLFLFLVSNQCIYYEFFNLYNCTTYCWYAYD